MGRLYLVRHAKAGDRARFDGDDRDRPLSATGKRQATLLAGELSSLLPPPGRILSSPAVRCTQTIAPLAQLLKQEIELVEWLEEGSDPLQALEKARPGFDEASLACTHGDVIWGVLEWLARGGIELGERPDAQKAGTWLIEWESDGADPSAAIYLPPPDRLAKGER